MSNSTVIDNDKSVIQIFVSSLQAVFFGALAMLISACGDESAKAHPSFGKVQMVEADGNLEYLERLSQNWTDVDSMNFWYTSQGSRIIPYVWFVNLELANAPQPTLFRNAQHMASLGYLPYESDEKYNPGGLPVGFALEQDANGDAWMGLTCAACHTGSIEVNNKIYFVDGGPTLGSWEKLFYELRVSFDQTLSDSNKFDRFAKAVLAEKDSPALRTELQNDMATLSEFFHEHAAINKSVPDQDVPDHYGYGRVDAFGIIQNAGSAIGIGDKLNKNIPNAPVSYPFLWGSHQSDVVQWNGMLPNTGIIGPLARNAGEVIGVYGGLKFEKNTSWTRWLPAKKIKYSGTVNFTNIGNIEVLLRDLRSPQLSEAMDSDVDATLYDRGRALYMVECSGCHEYVAREDEGKLYNAGMHNRGTDPLMAKQAVEHMASSEQLEGTKLAILFGDKFGPRESAIKFAINGTFGLMLKNWRSAAAAAWHSRRKESEAAVLGGVAETKAFENTLMLAEELNSESEFNAAINNYLSAVEANLKLSVDANGGGAKYKSRPLTGIWATAPYLHNGSVPNLRALLSPASERPTEFWVGSRKYDAENIGYVSSEGRWLYRVHDENGAVIPGNSNQGHEFPRPYTEEDKEALLTFLKTL